MTAAPRQRSHRTLAVALAFWLGTWVLTFTGKVGDVVYGWTTAGLATMAAGKWWADKLVAFRWGPGGGASPGKGGNGVE